METNLLPIGSVVLLNGGKKRLMIYGILQKNEGSDKTYDYIGCSYPEGYINEDNSYLFDTSDIAEVSYIGFVDSEYQLFSEKLKRLISEKANENNQ
jgi:hypothetical protein